MAEQKIVWKHFFPWQYEKLEQSLDDTAEGDWKVVQVNTFRQRFVRDTENVWLYRVEYTALRPGSAAQITQDAARTACGWEPVCQSGARKIYRCRVSGAQAEPAFPGDREGIRAVFRGRIRRQENIRIAALVLAALLLIAGYALLRTTKLLIYTAALPLFVMLINTLLIRNYERATPQA